MSGLKMQNTGHNQRVARDEERHIFRLRMSDADRRKLDALKEKTGWSGAKIISTLLQETDPDELKNVERQDFEPETDELALALSGLTDEVRRVGVNINQTAYVANRDNMVSEYGLGLIHRSVQEIHEIVEAVYKLYDQHQHEPGIDT
ncbi:hypothetical protein [Bifidobacterium crudilactis]|nr:hypothetical protein [Bifidobacterium crudilactis]MDN5978678.1 hypothetical protein [Bifidobacterium mongoliense]MDN6467699.1 hypothetical protein [Bifidobacterium crudilactis]MDN6558706.1 hypothetical protein [Bifidobacterium crudilactis]MDN6772665.1 hypothetical protein [Bifidobacterium crudilactis]MDN6802022.1 hypothetical protein [Bifidobacterium mongoliense]